MCCKDRSFDTQSHTNRTRSIYIRNGVVVRLRINIYGIFPSIASDFFIYVCEVTHINMKTPMISVPPQALKHVCVLCVCHFARTTNKKRRREKENNNKRLHTTHDTHTHIHIHITHYTFSNTYLSTDTKTQYHFYK